jgi:hypothetical protein
MNKPANHIGYIHELTDELQIEQAHHVYLDGKQTYPSTVMNEALKAVVEPILTNHYSDWKWYGGALINANYL